MEKSLTKLDLVKLFIDDAIIKDGNENTYYLTIGDATMNALYEKFHETDGWLYIRFLVEM